MKDGLDRAPDEILLESESDSMPALVVCSLHSDQRPLKGVTGLLDWRLRGSLSRFVIAGRISGHRDEVVYVPIHHRGKLRHLLLVGLGPSKGGREAPKTTLRLLADTVASLRFTRVAVSRSSFPKLEEQDIRAALQGIEVEFAQ